ncbi:hypothetical protein PS723_04409 [Pseudomonas fluorescens]|uniref:Uncharacterized protein n=1 Tax=Pseudomonas fluorescens TaxID=294 RepID=A0A5E7E9X6_PSEFL|nr:hypothetical protein PS723_04409 [Pseudomonas fluorescens]
MGVLYETNSIGNGKDAISDIFGSFSWKLNTERASKRPYKIHCIHRVQSKIHIKFQIIGNFIITQVTSWQTRKFGNYFFNTHFYMTHLDHLAG